MNQDEGYVPEIHLPPQSESAASAEATAQNAEVTPAEDPCKPEFGSDTSAEATESVPEAEIKAEPEPETADAVQACEDSFDSLYADGTPSLAAIALEQPEDGGFRKLWREKKVFIILTTIFMLLAIGLISGISYVYFVINPYENYAYILPNVYCAGVDLGGMTKEEAQAAIEEALRSPSYSVTVTLPDCSYEFQPAQEGITLNSASIAQRAYSYMRSDTSAFGMYKAYHAAEKTEYRLSAETMLSYSKEDIQALATQIYQETLIQATPSTLSSDPESHTVSITLGTPGRRIEPQTILDAVCLAFDSMDFSEITLVYEPVAVDLDAVHSLAEQAASAYCSEPVDPVISADRENHAIDVTMGTPGYTMNADDLYALAENAVNAGTYGTVSLDMTEVAPTEVDITAAYGELASEPTEPYYSGGTVYEGTYGYSLDWNTAVADILAASWGETLEIPMTPIAPEKTAAEIQAVLFRDQLSSYSSPHTAIANRTTNLTLACKAINGTVLNPGETFSFNGVVGERTAAKGYKEATVYVGTDSVGELGGGICQVASTIYDAVLYAD